MILLIVYLLSSYVAAYFFLIQNDLDFHNGFFPHPLLIGLFLLFPVFVPFILLFVLVAFLNDVMDD
jgi:hypothetical protein